MNSRQILREAAATLDERPLTDEEAETVSEALLEQTTTESRLIKELIEALGVELAAGWKPSDRTTRALLNITVFKVIGEAPL